MPKKFKIGVTERGDAAVHLNEWVDKAPGLDAIVAITKSVTPELTDFILTPGIKAKTILHTTITGYGGTRLEPGAPPPEESYALISGMIAGGFPAKQIVLRIDPIIPTEKGLEHVRKLLGMFKSTGIKRVRFSFLQYYKHAEARFSKLGWAWPRIDDGMKAACFRLFSEYARIYKFQSCATEVPPEYNHFCAQTGCVSAEDVVILGLEVKLSGSSYQRPKCLCCSAKTELLTHRSQCKNKCAYCYWVG